MLNLYTVSILFKDKREVKVRNVRSESFHWPPFLVLELENNTRMAYRTDDIESWVSVRETTV